MVIVTINRAFGNDQYAHVSLSPSRSTPYQSSITPFFTVIDGPLSDGKSLAHPLVVQIEEDQGEILVSEPRFALHASASTFTEAIAEFKRILSDELEVLTADEERLGPRLRAQLQYLRSIIRTV